MENGQLPNWHSGIAGLASYPAIELVRLAPDYFGAAFPSPASDLGMIAMGMLL